MKCPACVEAGLTSRFSEHHPPKEEGDVERFFDEEGRRHIHDHTVYSIVMTCSNNHAYQQKFRSICICRPCDWNDTPLVKAGQVPIGAAPRDDAP